MTVKKKKIGIALGGGGARGIAHIGVLKVLEEENIDIDIVAGVSMGAIIGACYSLGISTGEMEREAISMNKRKAVSNLMDLARPSKSLLKGEKAYKFISKFIGAKTFEETKIPFGVIATDLEGGDEVVINSGNIARAVQASMSVPGIFPPVKIGDNYLIDGGVVNPTPTDLARKMGADLVIGVDLVLKKRVKLNNPGIVTTLLQSYEIIRSQAVKFKIGRQEENGDPIIIQPEIRSTIDSFKFYNIHKFIESGEEATRKALPEIRKRIKEL